MQLYHLSSAFPEIPDAVIPHVVASRMPGPPERALASAAELMKLYAGPELSGADRFFAVETDASLFVPATRLAELQSRHDAATYMYRFTWRSPMQGGQLGACHALDVPFALGTLDRVPEFAGTGEAAERVARTVQSAWVAFARTGDPACPETGAWPPYDAAKRTTLFIDDPCRLVDAPDEERRRAWARARREES
jgi:para-nitrobenzyl esterase